MARDCFLISGLCRLECVDHLVDMEQYAARFYRCDVAQLVLHVDCFRGIPIHQEIGNQQVHRAGGLHRVLVFVGISAPELGFIVAVAQSRQPFRAQPSMDTVV